MYHSLITPELLALEIAVEWVRPVDTTYAYLREIVTTVNPDGSLPTPFFSIAKPFEIVGYALLDPHTKQGYKPPRRRTWVLWHGGGNGLDGIDWPVADGGYEHEFAIVAPEFIQAGWPSELVTEPRYIDDKALLKAERACDAALRAWSEHEAEQRRLLQVRADYERRRLETARLKGPYKG